MTAADAPGREGEHPPADVPAVVEATDICKRYGPTTALAHVSLRVLPGESHGLVGRNGAGKSTMVSILTGLQQPDTGTVRFAGRPAPAPGDRDAWRQRVACVYQHSTIIPALTVAENLFINRQPTRGGIISWQRMRREARALLDRWQVDIPVDRTAGDLPVEARQLVEIGRALSLGAGLIILDEPTAQLDGGGIARLFRHMRELQEQGITFLFISHHLQEVFETCQTVTVLRDARHVVTVPVSRISRDELIDAMTGEAAGKLPPAGADREPPGGRAVAVAVAGLRGPDYADISFSLARGEIVGLTGATSSGRIGVAEAVAGLRRPSGGTIRVNDRILPGGDVPAAIALGIGCVPQDRHREGLVLTQSMADNVVMAIGGRLGRFGFAIPRRKAAITAQAIASLGIVARQPGQAVASLSGGNQQKVVMARALASDPDVLVLIDPTAGVDIKSKSALLSVIERERDRGKAILMASGEIEDLRVCERVLVMFRGRITAEHRAGWRDGDLIADIEGLHPNG